MTLGKTCGAARAIMPSFSIVTLDPFCDKPRGHLGGSAMSNQGNLLAIASALPTDAAYEIDPVVPPDGRPTHYLATVADSNLRGTAGYGATRAEALQEAVDRYLTANWDSSRAESTAA